MNTLSGKGTHHIPQSGKFGLLFVGNYYIKMDGFDAVNHGVFKKENSIKK